VRVLLFVVLPLLFQVPLAVALALGSSGRSFLGLAVMYLSLVAVPTTALLNWEGATRRPPMGLAALTLRTLLITLVFPLLCLGLALMPW
jgi:hypothetical protein